MSTLRKLLAAAYDSQPNARPVNDVFATVVYSGTGVVQSIQTGIDLAGLGGLLWMKSRTGAVPSNNNHNLVDTIRGISAPLYSNTNGAQLSQSTIGSFDSAGFTLGAFGPNASGTNYVAYAFAEADLFFKKATVSHTNGIANNVDLSALGTVGMVIVKRTDSTGSWFVWHRSQTAGKLTYLEQGVAEATDPSIGVSGVTLNIAAALPTGTYVVYAWAHEGISKVFSYIGNGTNQTINCGFAGGARFVLIKRIDAVGDWFVWDTTRGIVSGNDPHLSLNTLVAEVTTDDSIDPSAVGFIVNQIAATSVNVNGGSYIGLAIA